MGEGEHTALAEAIKTLQVAIDGMNRTMENTRIQYETAMRGMAERFDKEIAAIKATATAHSLHCLFSPERDGMAQKTIDRVDKLETSFTKAQGALELIKWLGFGEIIAVLGLLAKAYFNI